MLEIRWANWDKELIAAGYKGKVTRKNPYAYGEKKHKPGISLKDIEYLVNTSKYIRNSRLAMFRISKIYKTTKRKYILNSLSAECSWKEYSATE